MTRARGGKTVFGACVGILMLETRFPRIPGDMGNAATWPFPVLYRVVHGATPERVVRGGARGLNEAFVEAGHGLVRDGADGITTTCGFLSLFQDELKAALGVPVAASSLMQAPWIEAMLPPGRRVGIVTVSKESLSEAHLRAAGVALDTPVIGTEGGAEFSRVILGDEPELDIDLARADVTGAAERLVAHHPEIGAILLECTNMVPYAADVRRTVGMPVFSIRTLVTWLHSGLVPRTFPRELEDGRL